MRPHRTGGTAGRPACYELGVLDGDAPPGGRRTAAAARRLVVAGAALAAVVTGAAGCGSPGPVGPPLSDAQVQVWLAAVGQRSAVTADDAHCYLVPRASLPAVVRHPAGAWVAEGYNDQTGDARRFAGCGIRAAGGAPGDGEIGIELSSAAGHDPDPRARQVRLPHTGWTLTVSSWPGTERTSAARLRTVEQAVLRSLASPPGPPSAYADPSSPLP
jgi:hypothetical protein